MQICKNGIEIKLEMEISPLRSPVEGTGRWHKCQNISFTHDKKLVAIIFIETVVLSENRSAEEAFLDIDEVVQTDWEIPLNYIDGHQLPEEFFTQMKETSSSKTNIKHLLIREITVHPDYRGFGIASQLIKEVAKLYKGSQSVWLQVFPIKKPAKEEMDEYSKAIRRASNPDKEYLINFYRERGFFYIENEHFREHPFMISTPSKIIGLLG